jgi:RNA polymerase sigma-70 factor (ECF subfamily)
MSTTDLLARLADGDSAAFNELFRHTTDRMRRLARKMLRRYPDVSRMEDTDDVYQRSAMRIHEALKAPSRPASSGHFYNLAAQCIQRELIDLARKCRNGRPADDPSGVLANLPWSGGEPKDLEAWSQFHECAENLPPKEREAFELGYYMGLPHEEAAAKLHISTREFGRRWRRAKEIMRDCSGGDPSSD